MRLCSIVLLVPLFAFHVVADEDAADDSKAWQKRRRAEFAEYKIAKLGPDGEVAVKLETNSLLSWSNPIRRAPAGAVYLWTIAGRPQLIASTYPYPYGIEQELTSLSELPLLARREDTDVHLFPQGIEWQPFAEVDAPKTSRTLRLTQMRRLAERFSVNGVQGTDAFEARLLTQPIYRSPVDSDADIAIFAFAQGTDPEAVLLIEAEETSRFRYALARMTTLHITADFDSIRVWDLPDCWPNRKAPDQPFHTVQLPGIH